MAGMVAMEEMAAKEVPEVPAGTMSKRSMAKTAATEVMARKEAS